MVAIKDNQLSTCSICVRSLIHCFRSAFDKPCGGCGGFPVVGSTGPPLAFSNDALGTSTIRLHQPNSRTIRQDVLSFDHISAGRRNYWFCWVPCCLKSAIHSRDMTN